IDFGAVVAIDQEPARIAAVAAVGQSRAVEGERQLDAAKWELMASAVLLTVSLDALLREPFSDLVVRDDGGPGALGDGDGIADMIAVAVGHENEVRRHVARLGRRGGVAGQERVDEEVFAVRLHEQAGVSEPTNAGR